MPQKDTLENVASTCTAQNPNFRAYFLNARLQCTVVSFSATVERLKLFIGGRGESVARNSTDDQPEL